MFTEDAPQVVVAAADVAARRHLREIAETALPKARLTEVRDLSALTEAAGSLSAERMMVLLDSRLGEFDIQSGPCTQFGPPQA